jgi:hypothetical protein
MGELRAAYRFDMVTKSRELFLSACDDIAETLSGWGFSYRRSGARPRLQLFAAEWQCELELQTTRSQTSESTAVLVQVDLTSQRVADYRAEAGCGHPSGLVLGGFLEYWEPYPDGPFPHLNLGGEGRRKRLAEVEQRVRRGPLSVLDQLRDPGTFVGTAADVTLVQSGGPASWIDYLAAYDQKSQIPALLRRFEAGLHWNDGSVRDQRRILVDAQRIARGLHPITDYNPAAAHHLVEALDRADRRRDLMCMALS